MWAVLDCSFVLLLVQHCYSTQARNRPAARGPARRGTVSEIIQVNAAVAISVKRGKQALGRCQELFSREASIIVFVVELHRHRRVDNRTGGVGILTLTTATLLLPLCAVLGLTLQP